MATDRVTGNENPLLSRRSFLQLGSATLAGASLNALGAAAKGQSGTSRPNVLFIITDQQHFDTISAAGCGYSRTPGMDRLVQRGTRFIHSYSTNPLCSPARSSMFTGRPTSETGVYQNNLAIRNSIPNLGQWLRQETDYETVYAGKWHIPRGFTHFIPGFDVIQTGIGGQGNIGDTSTSLACEAYLRNRKKDTPFLMVASFLQPHDICEWLRLNCRKMDALPYPELDEKLPPLPANFAYEEREPASVASRRKGNEGVGNGWEHWQWRYYIWSYYRHVEMVDAEVNRVLQALDATGHAENTLVVFTADHGEGTAHHQTTRKNNLYDEAARVPLMISWPGHIPEQACDTSHVVSGLDILPTICDYVGCDLPPNVRGASLKPILEGQAPGTHRFCVSEVNNNTGRMVRTLEFKYITYRNDPVEQLFDMQNDPGETRNLVGDPAFATALAEHRRLLREWENRLDIASNVPEPDTWRG